ncbi:hypothetical protein [Bizionia arctica]|uniref:Uncharacterized protein n=1 Tax=Bizionia arctica TaxID=1495645 RepID=A0A917GN66_9FLAO|nr:hypothetical protein [Bizionia arctica]GGG52407.1 hypothetical protein GCM10010976_24410 [Bizionia arctica]
MKKYLTLAVCLFCNFILTSQNEEGKTDDLGRIIINSYVPSQIEGLPPSARGLLENKLSQITSKNGMGGRSFNPRFIITPNINVLTKDITPTAPPMTALTLEVIFYIGDGIDGTLFANTSIQVKGVGTNETKAYISALKQIKTSNTALKELLEEGKTKIIEYYNSQCDFILKEAQVLESQKEYDSAIFKLTSVPDVCKECYDNCMDAVAPIYQKQIDRACEVKLAEAKNAWNANQNIEGANNVSYYLEGIDPNAACFSEVKKLTNQIANRIKEIDQKEWDFKFKEQQNAVDIQKSMIKAAQEIGVAYGNNQPQTITYNTRGWWY